MGDDNSKMFITIGALAVLLLLLVTTPGYQDVLGITGNESAYGMVLILIVIVGVLVYISQGKK